MSKLVTLPPSHLPSISDGDTPEVKVSIRMLGIDTPELYFPQGRDVALMDKALAALPRSAAADRLR